MTEEFNCALCGEKMAYEEVITGMQSLERVNEDGMFDGAFWKILSSTLSYEENAEQSETIILLVCQKCIDSLVKS